MRLTALQIEKLPLPAHGHKTHWEGGFGIRCYSGGTKAFVVQFSSRRRIKTIGKWPLMSLKHARHEAQRFLLNHCTETHQLTFEEALAAFLEDTATRARQSTVDGYWYRLKGITKDDLSRITLDDLPNTAQHRMAAKVFFNWCVRNEIVDKNPFAYVPIRWNARSRVLTDDELRQVWAYEYKPYSSYLKLSILTGQRIGQWKAYECSQETITFPAAIMKNGKEHTIPLTEWTASLLPIPQFNGWSKAKARIDKHVTIPHWTVHDLRRTFSTKMASLQVPLHVTERILSHASGTISGVAAVYNRYDFLTESRDALSVLEDHLRGILDV